MRAVSSWIDGFVQLTSMRGSPEIFRKWTGISIVACALERKVWTETWRGRLFPNLYVIIVGPPGAGKTIVAQDARPILLEIEDIHVASTSVTKASLVDELLIAERKIVRPQDDPPIITYNSLAVLSNELGVLLPAYESDFMSVLTDLWNCVIYSESRRTKERKFSIPNPQLNILACTTPSYLNNLLPVGAWDQGFLSRCMLVYSGAGQPMNLFSKQVTNAALYDGLIADLKEIFALFGLVSWSDEAAQLMNAWHMTGPQGGEPIPDHPKLQHYNIRRTEHLLKLCTIACVSTGSDLIITAEHFAEGLDWLVEMERFVPDIFKAMVMGGDQQVIQEVWHFAYKLYMGGGNPIPAVTLIKFLSQRTPAHNVMRLLDIMVRAEAFSMEHKAGVGDVYTPKPIE